ncbi:hypothetical protein B0H17DRAFT_1197727 [Mycena rosella]|uniref:Uncharacterized protein n=1 Tax=Mycena rosella TaxID=1033263 RepID=A0AAD7GP45_MYCRO|nr:hypothetical protein B0H17DRAFT_1197727 [Mycena rosella]
MATTLSTEQPFETFMATATTADSSVDTVTPTTPPDTVPENPAAGPAATPAADAGETPLANELRKEIAQTLGPSSATRPMTRMRSTQSVAAVDTAATIDGTAPAAQRASERGVEVSTFEHFGLAGPPTGKENSGPMIVRATRNLAKLADIVGTLDARFGQLETAVENIETELTIGATTRHRGETNDAAGGAPPAPNSSAGSNNGSVATVDDTEVLSERVDLLDKHVTDTSEHIQGIQNRVDDLEGRINQAAPPFSLIRMSNAMAAQFKTITSDRDTLKAEIEFQADAQLKINKKNAQLIAQLQATINVLETTVARLELAPTPPLLPSSHSRSAATGRVRSRSRSLDDSISSKRARSAAVDDMPFVIMGPVKMYAQLTPLQILQLHMDDALPKYILPAHFDVTLDPVQINHLRIRMDVQAETRALASAWGKTGNTEITMKLGGGDTFVGTHGTAASGYRASGRDGYGDSARRASSSRAPAGRF